MKVCSWVRTVAAVGLGFFILPVFYEHEMLTPRNLMAVQRAGVDNCGQ